MRSSVGERIYAVVCILLICTTLANLWQWRTTTRELSEVEIVRPNEFSGKMPSLPHLERTNARLARYASLLEDQNRIFREEIITRYSEARLSRCLEEARHSKESFVAEVLPADDSAAPVPSLPPGHVPGALVTK